MRILILLLLSVLIMPGISNNLKVNSYVGNYQVGSAWSHRGGAFNNNTRYSPHMGPQSYVSKWSYATGSSIYSSPAIDAYGNVYFGSYDTNVYALTSSGALIWTYATGSSVHASPAIAADGSILIGSYDYSFYSISPSGTLNWKFTTGNTILASATLGVDGTIYFASSDYYFYALTPRGTLAWKFSTGSAAHSTPAIGADGTLYFGSHGGNVYAMTSAGTLKWTFAATNGVPAGIALGADGTIFVGSQDSNMYAIAPDGTLKWSYLTGGIIYSGAAIGSDGSVYVGSSDSYLYAFSSLGTLKWTFKTGATAFGSPVIAVDGTVYFGSEDSYIYAVTSSGSLLWKKLITGGAFQCSPTLGSDGTLYMGSMGNSLYAIYTPPPTMMPTLVPTVQPSVRPSTTPSLQPTISLSPTTNRPSLRPSINPSVAPSYIPSVLPTVDPSSNPSSHPSSNPSSSPSSNPVSVLTIVSTPVPSTASVSSTSPIVSPATTTSSAPSKTPSTTTSKSPTKLPTKTPTRLPTRSPSFRPTLAPSTSPTTVSPTVEPSQTPSIAHAVIPSAPSVDNPSSVGGSSASGANSGSASSTGQLLIIILPSVAGSFLIAVLLLAMYCHLLDRSQSNQRDEDMGWRVKSHGQKVQMVSLDETGSAPGTNGYAPPTTERQPPQVSAINTTGNSALFSSASTELTSTPQTADPMSNEQTIPQVPWAELSASISAAGVATDEELLVGEGSFGSVVRVIWRTRSRFFKASTEREVVVKILKLSPQDSKGPSFDSACARVRREAAAMRGAEQHIFTDCIAKVYGVAQGAIPDSVGKILGIRAGTPCVGIVMRYEAGGDLAQYLHCKDRVFRELTLMQKLHILVGITKGIAELHGAGYVHGDIKPGNILLSSDLNPEVRLTDFGLAFMREDALGNTNTQMFKSTLNLTKHEHARGTPTYSAPEMLFDPVEENITIAKASRKTDVYALAILAWEVMTQKYPFSDIKSKEQLCWCVHQNQRPPLQDLPHYTPPQIKNLITSCWSKDRSQRFSASQCYSIASWHYQQLTTTNFDIFFSHPWSSKPFLAYVFEELSRRGYRVWYDQHEMGHDLKKSMVNGIKNCKVFLACLNSSYQTRENCMFELEEAKSIPGKTVITLLTEDNPLSWADDRLMELCDFKSQMCVNISQHAKLDWEAETDALPYRLAKLRKDLEPLIKVLAVNGCAPTFQPKAPDTGNKNSRLSRVSSTMIRNLLSMSER